MNSKVEKWLTTGALIGWVASIGSLMVLAVQATMPKTLVLPLSSPANAENVNPVNSVQKGSMTPAQGHPEPLEAKVSSPEFDQPASSRSPRSQ